MYIKAVAVETKPDGNEVKTSLMFPLSHPMCQLYDKNKWTREMSFIYDMEETDLPKIINDLGATMTGSALYFSCAHRRIYEIWECKPKDVFWPNLVIQACDLLELPYDLDGETIDNIRTFPFHQDVNSILNLGTVPFNFNPWSRVAQNGIALTELIMRVELVLKGDINDHIS